MTKTNTPKIVEIFILKPVIKTFKRTPDIEIETKIILGPIPTIKYRDPSLRNHYSIRDPLYFFIARYAYNI